MFKKIFCAAFLMAAIILVGNANVSAQDVWVYTDKDNREYYVRTETFVNEIEYRANRRFKVDVVEVHGANYDTKHFYFHENDCMVQCRIDEEGDFFVDNKHMLALKVWEYSLKHLGIDYEVRCDG